MTEQQLTDDEKQQLQELLGYGSGVNSASHNVHTFLFNVATAKDTTKLGFLKDDEIGKMDNPIRSFKFLSLFADKVMQKEGLKEFFEQRSEIGTSTSLSRDGFLTKLAVVQRKELADLSPKEKKKENKSWYKPKDKDSQEEAP